MTVFLKGKFLMTEEKVYKDNIYPPCVYHSILIDDVVVKVKDTDAQFVGDLMQDVLFQCNLLTYRGKNYFSLIKEVIY